MLIFQVTLLYAAHFFITTVEINSPAPLKITIHYTPLHRMTSSYLGCSFLFLCLTTHILHIPLSLSLITFSLVWFHFLCSLALPVDLGGWQSHPVQPARLLETEQPSSPHWTHTHTDRQTDRQDITRP